MAPPHSACWQRWPCQRGPGEDIARQPSAPARGPAALAQQLQCPRLRTLSSRPNPPHSQLSHRPLAISLSALWGGGGATCVLGLLLGVDGQQHQGVTWRSFTYVAKYSVHPVRLCSLNMVGTVCLFSTCPRRPSWLCTPPAKRAGTGSPATSALATSTDHKIMHSSRTHRCVCCSTVNQEELHCIACRSCAAGMPSGLHNCRIWPR
jgi:hypothetical protein